MNSLNGLDIDEVTFRKMKTKDQNHVIYRNVALIRRRMDSVRFHRKVLYAWCSALTTGLLVLFGLKKFVSI